MKINAIDETGKLKEYDVILTYHSDEYNKDYIVYTDNIYNSNNNEIFGFSQDFNDANVLKILKSEVEIDGFKFFDTHRIVCDLPNIAILSKDFNQNKQNQGRQTPEVKNIVKSMNIQQILIDFKSTINAIGASEDVEEEVNGYLELIDKQTQKENPKHIILWILSDFVQ